MTDLDLLDDWLDDGRSGQFTADARVAATTAALPLLASYFTTGRDTLRSQEILSREAGDSDLGELLEFVQIRVLLAAAEHLEGLLRAVLGRPSFQYQRISEESVGVIRGRLDTIVYMRRRHEVSAPRRFPVKNVRRSHLLPENVLATWAALSIAGSLKRLPLQRLPTDAPERRRAERAAEALRRLANQPALADCVDAASSVWRSGSQSALVERVRTRVRSGRLPNSTSYERLADWVDQFDAKNLALDPGSVEWVFYDESFDTRLFELWCLHELVRALTAQLGEPTTSRYLVDRSDGAIAEWAIGGVIIEVWFQAGLGKVDVGSPRWGYDPRPQDEDRPSGRFGGIPDISIVVQQPGQPRRPVLIDPKLRQRDAVPGAEMYKIIGYFGNLPADHAHRGAIIFHGPLGTQRRYRISDGGSGEILAVAVDPLDEEDASRRFTDLATFVIATVPPSTMTRARGPEDPHDPESVEDWAHRCQQEAVQEMAAAISPDNLERSRKALRSNLLDTWEHLDTDTQRMLATAEHFGGGVTPDMDHSGPLLGLAAACERLLRNFTASLGVAMSGPPTFGRLLQSLDDACNGHGGYQARSLRTAILSRNVDVNDLHLLITDLFTLNSNYRIPAAHADVLEEAQWFAGRAEILVGGNAAISRIVRVLKV